MKIQIFYFCTSGPGWQPGKPRLGNYDEIPIPENPPVLFDPPISLFAKCYVIIHFAMILVFYHELTLRSTQFTQFLVTFGVIALLFSITCIGFLMEGRQVPIGPGLLTQPLTYHFLQSTV